MIDVKELRVGNLVNMYFEETFIRIKQISPRDLVLISDGKKRAHSFDPIPLTAEILESAGFEKWPNSNTYSIEFEGNTFQITDIEFFLGGEDTCTSGHGLTGNIYFVHQLQNLYFALTHKELSINLTASIHESR